MKLKVLVGLMFVLLLTGCGSAHSSESEGNTSSKYEGNTRYFQVISDEINGRVIYDTRTGIEYWQSGGYSNVLTVLVDEEGKPLIYDRSKDE